jgi:hypothetical protein
MWKLRTLMAKVPGVYYSFKGGSLILCSATSAKPKTSAVIPDSARWQKPSRYWWQNGYL